MDVIRSNLISIINKFIFSGIILLMLRNPLVIMIAELEGFSPAVEVEIWVFLTLSWFGIGNLIVNRMIKNKLRQQISIILLLVSAAIIPIWLAWPYAFFLTLTLILYIISLRGNMYDSRIDFSTDLPWILFFYLLLLVAAGSLGAVPALGEVILLILLVILFGIFLQIKQEKFASSASAFKIFLPFFAFLLIIAFVLSLPFNIQVYSAIITLGNYIYEGIFGLIDLIFVPVSYLVLVVYYIVRWLQRIFGGEPEIMEELGGFEEAPEEQLELAEPASETVAGNVAAIIFIILLGIFAWWFLQKYLNYGAEKNEDVIETRENLDAARLFKQDAKNFFNNLRSRLSWEDKEPQYELNDPCQKVRHIYYSFLQKAEATTFRSPGASPRQYCEQLTEQEIWREYKSALHRLTRLYEKARYGEKVTVEEVETAEQLWREISRINLRSDN